MSRIEPPKSPALVTLCVIAFLSFFACLLLVASAANPYADERASMQAWADFFALLAVVSFVGAVVLGGVRSLLAWAVNNAHAAADDAHDGRGDTTGGGDVRGVVGEPDSRDA